MSALVIPDEAVRVANGYLGWEDTSLIRLILATGGRVLLAAELLAWADDIARLDDPEAALRYRAAQLAGQCALTGTLGVPG